MKWAFVDTLFASTLIVLLTFSAGCNRTQRYPMQGEVMAKDATTGEITVKHGNIPGFMEAMTMPYRVKDPAVLRQIEAGDKISAEVVVGKDRSDYWLENVRITDQSGRGQAKPPGASRLLTHGGLFQHHSGALAPEGRLLANSFTR